MFQTVAYARRQDDSLPFIQRLISQGYDKAVWHLNEAHPEYDICDSYDGQVVDLNKLVSGLQHEAPIFELGHVNCLCYLICYSTTNPDLEYIVVDWRGGHDEGRSVDRQDRYDRSKDFQNQYDNYRQIYDELSTNKFLTGNASEPENGIYSFDITLYGDTYYDVNAKNQLKDEALKVILDIASRYKIKIEDSSVVNNDYLIQTEYDLGIYDWSKEDFAQLEWTLDRRRKELNEITMDLKDLRNFLTTTQDEINKLLIKYEQSTTDIQDYYE